jgi:membrane peptidoglycan carboxypeptidase
MGQEIGVTPLQIVRMVSAIANGGKLYQPYIVKKVEDVQKEVVTETQPQSERAISSETAAKLRDMLESVVTDGTATAGRLEGHTAAGKTGTAQKIDETGHYSPTKYVASFAGFAPATNPVVSIIVMIDEPIGAHHGGEVAAPAFKRIAEEVLRYMAVPPDVPSYAPQYTIKEQPKPQRRLEPTPRPSAPKAAQLISLNIADAGLHELGDITIPDFHGKSLRQVTEETLKAGLHLQSIGSGAAFEQTPPAGASVRAGSRIEVRFSSRVER